jgi:hypothetical protein
MTGLFKPHGYAVSFNCNSNNSQRSLFKFVPECTLELGVRNLTRNVVWDLSAVQSSVPDAEFSFLKEPDPEPLLIRSDQMDPDPIY